MAPPLPKKASNDKWHISGYDPERYDVKYELVIGTRTIQVNDPIKVKNKRGTFRFGRVAKLLSTERVWVDCLHDDFGWCSYYVDDIKPVPIRRKRK